MGVMMGWVKDETRCVLHWQEHNKGKDVNMMDERKERQQALLFLLENKQTWFQELSRDVVHSQKNAI